MIKRSEAQCKVKDLAADGQQYEIHALGRETPRRRHLGASAAAVRPLMKSRSQPFALHLQ